MDWVTLRGVGRMRTMDSVRDGKNMRKTRDLLQGVSRNFARGCVSYHDVVGEWPFVYGERQLHSILIPAIAKHADAVFLEQPISRKSIDAENHGWLDYWVLYRDVVFLIELKHAFFSIASGKLSDRQRKLWSQAIAQLEGISSSQAQEIAHAGGIVKIALMVLPFSRFSKHESRMVVHGESQMDQYISSVTGALDPHPDWACLWLLHEELQRYEEVTDGYEIYPAVCLTAKIECVK